jgi:hypothetical protein
VRRLLALAAILVTGSPLPAAAYNRSHVVNKDGSIGPALFWCTRSIPFITNEKGSKDAGPSSIDAVKLSFDAWTHSTCSDLKFADQGTTPRTDVGFDQASNATDNINLVVWREVSCVSATPANDPCLTAGGCNNKYDCWEGGGTGMETIALTTTTFNVNTGEIYDTDIELNGAGFVFSTVDSPPCTSQPPHAPPVPTCVATDIRNTLTHEVGHVTGLDHNTTDPTVTMYPTAGLGDTDKRAPHQDDIDGLCAIYPVGAATEGCQTKACGCGATGSPWAILAALLLGPWTILRRRISPT